MTRSEPVLLSLGSNLDPQSHLVSAALELRQRFPGVRFSPVYRSPAVGFAGPEFLNAAALMHSDLEPEALNAWLHALEDRQGRRRDQPRFASRSLDIDIVLFGQRIATGPGNLQLPREDLRFAFVLRPACDLAADLIEPRSGLRLIDLWALGAAGAESLELHPLEL